MRIPRFFLQLDLVSGTEVALPRETAHRLIHVLRMKAGQSLRLFNGKGGEYEATVSTIHRTDVSVLVNRYLDNDLESTLFTDLGIAVIKRNAMDAALTRATEMGVSRITPLITANSSIRKSQLTPEHWLQIISSSCEQCGRNTLPCLNAVTDIDQWLSQGSTDIKLVADPHTSHKISDVPSREVSSVAMLTGPEGGLTQEETRQAESAGFLPVGLGKRILRAETVPIALLALVQHHWGDM